jgi:hypothetical protein
MFHNKNQNEDLSGFIDLYKPKIVIDEEIPYEDSVVPRNMSGMYMFFSRLHVFSAFKRYALENNIHYDFVCVYRLDLLTLYDIHFETLVRDDNTVNIPNIAHSGGLNDFLAIGSLAAIEKYCCLAQNYKTMLTITNNTGSNEFMLLSYLRGIQMNFHFFPFRCLLRDSVRENGGATTNVSMYTPEELGISII